MVHSCIAETAVHGLDEEGPIEGLGNQTVFPVMPAAVVKTLQSGLVPKLVSQRTSDRPLVSSVEAMTAQFLPVALKVCEFHGEARMEIDDKRLEVEECCKEPSAHDRREELGVCFEEEECKMLLDEEPHKGMPKPVEIHTSDLVARNLYIGRQPNFDIRNTVSEVNTTNEKKYLASPTIATRYGSPLTRCRLVNCRNTFGRVILPLSRINNSALVGSLKFQLSLRMYLMTRICARGLRRIWRRRSSGGWDGVC